MDIFNASVNALATVYSVAAIGLVFGLLLLVVLAEYRVIERNNLDKWSDK